jgi:nucleotide-binding universal stress UspA family protein
MPTSKEVVMYADVVVGIDGTDAGRDALALGETLVPRSARLTLAHVRVLQALGLCGDNGACGAGTHKDSIEMLSAERSRAAAAAEILSVLAPDVGSGLRDVAESRGADLLVVGSSRGAAIGRVLAGDDTRAALHGAPCAVAVAPRGYRTCVKPLEVIGVAGDGSAQSRAALTRARALSLQTGARVIARHVIAGDAEVRAGPSGEQLAAFSETVDVLICGSRDNGIVRRVALGSTSKYLSRHCACPLIITTALVQKPAACVTPDRLATA